MSHILTLTLNPTIDMSCAVDRVVPEHKLRCTAPELEPGGGGINVARAVRRLGGRAAALWTRGGTTGQLLQQLLHDAGVEHQPIPISGMTRQNLIVYEESSGRQYRFGFPGPEFTQAEAERCLEVVSQIEGRPDFVVLSGSLPLGVGERFYADVIHRVPGGSRIVLDTSGPALAPALEAGVCLIKPNLRELGELAGRELESDEEVEEVARGLVDAGKAEVVVTSIGSGGAILVTQDLCEHIRAPTVRIRSKVGAGDSMVAGIVHSLARGNCVQEAVRFGVAAGAAAVMTPATALCPRSETERLYRELSLARKGLDRHYAPANESLRL